VKTCVSGATSQGRIRVSAEASRAAVLMYMRIFVVKRTVEETYVCEKRPIYVRATVLM